MLTIVVQPDYPVEATCPKCANRVGIRSGGPSLAGHLKYDVLSDTYGTVLCPACKHRAAWIEFHQPHVSGETSPVVTFGRNLKG